MKTKDHYNKIRMHLLKNPHLYAVRRKQNGYLRIMKAGRSEVKVADTFCHTREYLGQYLNEYNLRWEKPSNDDYYLRTWKVIEVK